MHLEELDLKERFMCFQVLLGGGRQSFRPASAGGKRKDDRDLIEV